MSAFADIYGKYEIQGTALYNRRNPDCAGAELDISKAAQKYQPITLTLENREGVFVTVEWMPCLGC